MIGIRNNPVVFSLVLVALLSTAHLSVASEITGTLSSDGSAETDQGAVIGETNTGSGEVTGQTTVGQSSGQIQGTVVQGREESALLAMADSTAWNTAMWSVPLTGVAIAALVFLLWRRGSF